MKTLWDINTKYPTIDEIEIAPDMTHIVVHKAISGHYEFLLGAILVKYHNKWFVAWGNSKKFENDSQSIMAGKTSIDNLNSFSKFKVIASSDGEYSNSHGVYYENNDKLYSFIPLAKYDYYKKTDTPYADLKMLCYKYIEKNDSWQYQCIALDDMFWPLCEPIKMKNGYYLMAGLDCSVKNGAKACVAISNGDMRKWDMIRINDDFNDDYNPIWAESTVIQHYDKLVLIARSNDKISKALVSYSFDFGQTWSKLEESNMHIDGSKPYAGTLSTGQHYLIYNHKISNNYRDALAIAVTKPNEEYFSKIYYIQKNYLYNKTFEGGTNQICYPYAVEQDGILYIAYSVNKEDCYISKIPINKLQNI